MPCNRGTISTIFTAMINDIAHLFFLIEVKIMRALNIRFSRRSSSQPFLSGDTFRSYANKFYESEGDFFEISDGDVVFVVTHMLDLFYENVMKSSCSKFTLITHNSDKNIHEIDCFENIVNSKNLKLWFAQNNVSNFPKIISIPIGLENRWWHKNGIISDFIKLRKINPKKKARILYGFNVHTNRSAREEALKVVNRLPLAEYIQANSRKYRELLSQYMFVISPPGNGIDCHRTWEALYLNVIPILVDKNLCNGFPNFPGLILNEWSDLYKIDERQLIQIYYEKIEILRTSDWLWSNYWQKKIGDSALFSY